MASGSSFTADEVLQLALTEENDDIFTDESDDEFVTESRSDLVDSNGAESLYPDNLLAPSSLSLLFHDGDVPEPAERDSILRDEDDEGSIFLLLHKMVYCCTLLGVFDGDLPSTYTSESDGES